MADRDDIADAVGCVPADTCTLPSAEQPLRVAEFDALLADALVDVERRGSLGARLLLTGDDGLAERAQRLADAESSCCSFFAFTVTALDRSADSAGSRVALDVEVPPAYARVLAGLVDRAAAARRAVSRPRAARG